MSIEQIDSDLCNGCGICINSCPTDVIKMDEKSKKVVITYPEDCMMVCEFCVSDCPTNAISVTPGKSFPGIISWR